MKSSCKHYWVWEKLLPITKPEKGDKPVTIRPLRVYCKYCGERRWK